MNVQRGQLLYEGKAKRVYEVARDDAYLVEFKDDATAFNGEKKGQIVNKGILNNRMSAHFFELLEKSGVRTHFLQTLSEREMLVKRVRIIAVEVVCRNIVAGTLAKRLGIAEGVELGSTVVEFYYKDDALGDPLINRSHAQALQLATRAQLDELEARALEINDILKTHLVARGLLLVDFKLEFGITQAGELILADEISPDTCRLWDVNTREKLDKDRFRRDLGGVEQAYEEVWRRLQQG